MADHAKWSREMNAKLRRPLPILNDHDPTTAAAIRRMQKPVSAYLLTTETSYFLTCHLLTRRATC